MFGHSPRDHRSRRSRFGSGRALRWILSLRTLLTNFTGTTGAVAYAGKTRSLDANDPWGSTVQLDEDEWPEQLTDNLNAISAAWCQQDIWQGTIQGTVMPARSLGEMALIEVVLHGWDVARATGQQVEVSDALGAELLRCVAETADLGRQVGAYGPKVPVADNASGIAKALGLAGRSPN